ncbi:DUF1351 domain-containing protein [Fusobacterium nucleatum]|uniref:DUF1351 domain-containing protein n=1 Tax=Podoviridae sp. ct8nN1 TaxID=2827296 RepID=A0A8S5R344_9CAUD|nr:MAG TPA: Protein of unknown function (DUF1351) [Podoviridae sp. ct8nN1]
MEIKTISQVPAVINFNFDDVKRALQEYSEKYKDLVVTEENEKEMVNVKNELGRLEKEIDKYRLDNKKIMEKPIKEFETKCKDLIEILKNVSDPIREQLNLFEENRKKQKEEEVKTLIENVISKYGLEDKYAAQLTINSKYLNKGQKENDTIKDLEQRAELLKNSQDQEKQLQKIKEERIDFIQKTIENKNKELNLNLKISNFMFLVDKELTEIMEEIEVIFTREVEKSKKSEEIKTVVEEQKIPVKVENDINTTASYIFTIKDLTTNDIDKIRVFLEDEFYNFDFKKI